MNEVGEKIASFGGIIVEIGVGPGGGYMPYVLKENTDSIVIISDISPIVVREWKDYLDKILNSPNIYYAVFDFCQMPFADNSIDVISDGGVLVTSTGFVNKDTLATLSEEAQRILLEKRPDVFEDLYEEAVLAGFKKIDNIISGCWHTDDDDSEIADLARSLGINLEFTSYIRYCTKE